MLVKQLCKIFKKSALIKIKSSTSTNSKDEGNCNNSLQLKVVNVSIVTLSSISDVGRDLGPAS